MRVKRLEIQGFKSFKDKTVIHFDHSITGIVGPNGCGKSNIVDAFFWVMGEQAYKHMRGSSSDDLIFNGSSKYSPLGMAEATLVMETDYVDTATAPAGASYQEVPLHLKTKEISVTRRVYRSGEGEYFINGAPSRLKDVHELFMDTGVGTKGYSIIEQGQIGKIVGAKPEERRVLIEEAAGIAKYKARKKESLRKMEATQGNLSRLNDVIAEIERSLNSLERQAQKARLYRKYKDELQVKEIGWGRRRTSVLRQQLETLKSQREAFEQELVGLKAELQTAENSIETDRVAQLTDTKLAEDLQAKVLTQTNELTQRRSALDLSQRRQEDLGKQLESLLNERQDLESSVAAEREKVQSIESVGQDADVTFKAAAEKAQALDSQVRTLRSEVEQMRSTSDRSKKEIMAIVNGVAELGSKAASLQGRIQSAEDQAQRLKELLETQEVKVTVAREEASKARAQLTELQQKLAATQVEKKSQAEKVSELDTQIRQTEANREKDMKAVTQMKSRLQSLEELAAAYEGFGDGPKAVLDWAKKSGHTGKLAPLADFLDVSSGYEKVTEAWLEGRIQNLVCENPDVATAALTEIRDRKQGRASVYIAVDSPAGRTEDSSIRKAIESQGFEVVGLLKDFVKISSGAGASTQKLLESLIAGVWVLGELEAGGLQKLSKVLAPAGASAVTLSGEVIENGTLVRGGSSANAEASAAASVLGRRRAIEDTRLQVFAAENDFAANEERLADLKKSVELARAKLQALQADYQTIEIQQAAMDRDVHQSERIFKEAEGLANHTRKELDQVQSQSSRDQADLKRSQDELAQKSERKVQLEAEVQEIDASLNGGGGKDSVLREQDAELQGLRVEEATLRERATSLKNQIQSARELIKDREKRLAEIQQTLSRVSTERETHTGGDASTEGRIQELLKLSGATQDELNAVKDRLEQSSAKVNAAMSRIKELHALTDEKSTKVNQFALEMERLGADLNHMIQNIEEKYGAGSLTNPQASPIQEEMSDPVVTQPMTEEEERQLGEEVERMRERIRRLGEVNPMAVEEYEETKERFDRLVNERSDLLQSIDNLQEAIDHINKTSEERFQKAFEAIAERFAKLFPIIFGGGQARLSLVFPEGAPNTDILEAGVDILAQPPGKKIVNISLLSGGEKALTAVSLIFAIFMVKPAPFCLLDEVDAPLDDANIGKFNALLREMSSKSQFILITHNKKTMELNDTLYGVTMEEPGVSKMVSIEMQ
ncbi:chromosome segregation protein SMC [bacterium]|jgi:chromosome segregation protein|nr:chromosome segregation protein SMC [bacterium]